MKWEAAMLLRCLLSVLVALMLAGQGWIDASAQVEPVGIVSTNEREVYRRYLAPESSVTPVFDGKPISLYSFGIVEPSEAAARRSMELVPGFVADIGETIFADLQAETGVSIESEPPAVADIAPIGDESVGYTIKALYGTIDVEFGMVLIRDEAWIQWVAASAFASSGTTLSTVEEVAQSTKDRWPSDSTITVRADGLRTGGIWNMAALPEDVPDHLELDRSYDEGPGPDPTPTPTPKVVPTSPSDQSEKGQSPQAPHGSRLAEPFDVTFRAILAGKDFQRDGQGMCSGVGAYMGIREDGTARLMSGDGSEELASLESLESGFVSYDLELNAEVCVVEFKFDDVPPRASFQLVGGGISLGTFTFDDIAGQRVIEFVVTIGDES